MSFPSVQEIAKLCRSIKKDIHKQDRAYDEDDRPGILLTVGADKSGDWSYQTGDTQFSGGAYGYPHWGQAAIYRSTNCTTAAREILRELRDAAAEDSD